MSEFLVEAYVSRSITPIDPARFDVALGGVRLVRTIFVPADETCFYLLEARSIEAVREAVLRAGVSVERITEAVSAG